MSARNYAQTLTAGQVIKLPGGRFFYIRTAAAVLDIATEGNPGAPVEFLGVSAGSKFGPVPEGQGWNLLRITSATAQAIEIIISDDALFDLASAVTVNGSVTTAESPSTALASPASTAVANAGTQTIPANVARRRVSVCNPSSGTGSLFLQVPGAGAGLGIELQPGITMELRTTAAIGVRNDSGATQNFVYLEET